MYFWWRLALNPWNLSNRYSLSAIGPLAPVGRFRLCKLHVHYMVSLINSIGVSFVSLDQFRPNS